MTEPVFVGREDELLRLGSALQKAAGGSAQVAFIAGEAGLGKTSLITEFIQQARRKDPALVAAIGECNAQTGLSDPYLPFRQILTSLTSEREEETKGPGADKKKHLERLKKFAEISTKTLLMLGPDLVGIFVPGGAILGRGIMALGLNTDLAGKLSKKIGKDGAKVDPNLDQGKIFEQYTSVLKALSKENPLVLVLDDLQWADGGSLNLLFHLARELKDSRVLILGTYRPDDVALGRGSDRHPLEPILNELKRYYGDIILDLAKTGQDENRAFVDALIDSEPNQLDASFRDELYQHTNGQPLFTVEVLRNLQECGNLVKDSEGRWIQAEPLDWKDIPARVEGIVSERVRRLPEDLHEILTVSSVAGEEFTAQVVAQVQKAELRALLGKLSHELEKRYMLVTEQGEVKVGARFLSKYRFSHVLIQQYLYEEIGAGEKRLLHGEIAETLEGLFAGHTDQIPLQLAHHYEAAGIGDKAAEYLLLAADGAYSAFAYNEAIETYSRALELGKENGLENEKLTRAYLRRGRAYELTRQFDLALRNYAEMLSVALQKGDRSMELAEKVAASTLYSTTNPVADASLGQALSEETLALARQLGDRAVEAKALWNLQLVNLLQSKPAEAIIYGEKSLAIATELDLTEQMAYVLSDLGWAYNVSCQFEKSIEKLEAGAALWRQLGNQAMLYNNLNISLYGYLWMGAYEKVLTVAAEAYQMSAAINEIWNQAYALNFQSQVWFDQGEIDKALNALQESIRLSIEGHLTYTPWYRAMLVRNYAEIGAFDAGMEIYKANHTADKQIKDSPTRTALLMCYAQFEVTSGDLEAARSTLAGCSASAPLWESLLFLSRSKYALALEDIPAANESTASAVELCRSRGVGQYLPEALFLQGRAYILSKDTEKAMSAFEQALAKAEVLGSRRLLWQIYAAMAATEPDGERSAVLKDKSDQVVQEIAAKITPLDLKEGFLRFADHTRKKLENRVV